jgi:hypothetical protein
MNMMTRPTQLALLLALVTPIHLFGDVIETDSTRFIVVRNQGGPVIDGPHQIDAMTTTGAFDEYVQSSAWDQTHGGSSESLQDSNITNGVYSVHLEVGTDAAGGTMGTDIATGYAEAFFEVRFTVTEPTDFNIAGTYNSFGEINGAISEVELRIDSISGGSPSQVIAYATDNCCPSVNTDGTLLPGDYAFRAHALGIVDHSFMMSYNTSTSGTNVTMTLDIPQPNPLGDMDCNGAVDIDDVAPFIRAMLDPSGYESAFPGCDKDFADINGDAVTDGADIADFAACVIASGCP